MSKTARGRKKLVFLQKPSGRLTPRVQAVGPDHFGIIAVDPAKSRSCYMLCNFYGNVLSEPTYVPHTRGELHAAIDRIRQTLEWKCVKDCGRSRWRRSLLTLRSMKPTRSSW